MSHDRQEILDLNQRLLDAIDQRDWPTYTDLCDPELTAFEPEAQGHLVRGMAFHAFYLEGDAVAPTGPKQSTISSPDVTFLGAGDVALVTYVRLVQRGAGLGDEFDCFEETRLWQQRDGCWRHVHFHRSRPGKA